MRSTPSTKEPFVTIELTITAREHALRDAFDGKPHDLLALAVAAAPSVKLLAGNTKYAISVSVDESEEPALCAAMNDLCTIAPRTFLNILA